ncbi:hypothetical protein J6590_007086 [Homalodisca vitripennis]|nr:hypothetical protein J6590_007086 [Homalodisca vitripennis]
MRYRLSMAVSPPASPLPMTVPPLLRIQPCADTSLSCHFIFMFSLPNVASLRTDNLSVPSEDTDFGILSPTVGMMEADRGMTIGSEWRCQATGVWRERAGRASGPMGERPECYVTGGQWQAGGPRVVSRSASRQAFDMHYT